MRKSLLHAVFFAWGVVLCTLLCGCSSSHKDARLAASRVERASVLIDEHRYQSALRELDSVHLLYPRQVEQRRRAKALQDTVTYLQAQRSLIYADSLLQTLLPEADRLLKEFRYEKNDRYEDCGQYVYRTLQTGWNTNRCFLQAYVSDERQAVLKSYYFGGKQAHQHAVRLQAGEQTVEQQGSNHAFEVEGWHEILTLGEDESLEVLNFVSSHTGDKVKVSVADNQGKTKAVYYLSDNEKQALDRTYALGLVMRDIAHLEADVRLAAKRIERFETKRESE